MADTPANFGQALISSDDRSVDSIIMGGIVSLIALILFSGYALWRDPAAFNPINFGSASTMILAGVGGGRRLRDWNDKSQDHSDPQH